MIRNFPLWSGRVALENRLAPRRALERSPRVGCEPLRKGDHVLVEGTLVSNTYEWEARKGEKTTAVKQTSWSIRADAVRKLNRTD